MGFFFFFFFFRTLNLVEFCWTLTPCLGQQLKSQPSSVFSWASLSLTFTCVVHGWQIFGHTLDVDSCGILLSEHYWLFIEVFLTMYGAYFCLSSGFQLLKTKKKVKLRMLSSSECQLPSKTCYFRSCSLVLLSSIYLYCTLSRV